MARSSPSRRRQRSVRVTVALALMSLGTAAVLVAVPLSSYPLLSAASVLAIACGWASARILFTELVQHRRAHARDRAAQSRAFRALFTDRSAQHAAFASAMTDRLTARHREVRELEGTLRLSEGRAAEAEDRVRREARRANEAQARVSELEVALAIRSAEQMDELATRDAAAGAELDTVVDLLAWEDRSHGSLAADARSAERKHA